jgi:Dpy-30 motif
MDHAYLKEHVGPALTVALAECAKARPDDAIEFVAHLLQEYERQRGIDGAEAALAQERLALKVKSAEEEEFLKLKAEEAAREETERLESLARAEEAARVDAFGEKKQISETAAQERLAGLESLLVHNNVSDAVRGLHRGRCEVFGWAAALSHLRKFAQVAQENCRFLVR